MSAPNKLSATMAIALAEAIDHGGVLERRAGGFWTFPGAQSTARNSFEWWVGASTIQALVTRGELQYTQWKEGRGGRFPIQAKVTAREVAFQ